MLETGEPSRNRFRLPSLRRDFGLQLLAVYLLFVVPVVAAGLAFDAYSSERLRADVEASDLALARAIALETDARIRDAIDAVRRLGEDPGVLAADPSRMEPLFADVATARPDINLIYRLGADGVMLFHYPTGPGSTVGTDFSFRPYFKQAMATRQPVVSEGRISPTTGQPVATTVMPLVDRSGNFLGVVATNIALQSLSETLASIAREQGSAEGFRVSIIDSSGQVIAEPDPQRLLAQRRDELPGLVALVLAGEEGTHVGPDASGREWLHAYVPISAAGWGVIVERSAASAFASARAFHAGLLAAIGIFIAGGALFWITLTHRVIRPLERLAAFSLTIGTRPGDPRPEREALAPLAARPDQMGHLVRSLERMELSIQERLQELATLLDTGQAVVSTLDSSAVLARILEQTGRLTGADTCAIVALDRASNTFRVRASRGLSRSFIEKLRIDPSTPDSPSMRAIRSRQPIQVSDTETDASYAAFRERARGEGYRALLAVPLITQHAPPATLVVYHRSPHVFSEREVRLVWNFANHAAMAIENAALYARSDEQLQEQTRRLEALVQSMNDGLILEDLSGSVLYANRRVCDLAGIPPDEVNRHQGTAVLARLADLAMDPALFRQDLESTLGAAAPQTVVLTLRRPRPTSLRLSTFAVTDSEGEIIGRGEILQDITRETEIDRMKTALVATASHELRTPLAAIKGYATTLLAQDVTWDPVAQREFLQVISQETDRLSHLVDDLLDLSRIEGGSLHVVRQECHLDELVDAAQRSANPSPGERLQIDVPADLPVIEVDRRRIESVLRNLLENAALYAGPQARVHLSAQRQNGVVVIRVEDTGPGIPREDAGRVFEPFVRLDGGWHSRTSGAGLGLTICRGFVEAHGGKIWLEPSAQGACVVFSIPLQGEVDA
jgi:PAS domain S-box-containing protein